MVVDVAGNCGDHETGDKAQSKSVNTSSQSGTRHPKVHVWQTLHFILKKNAYHIQMLGLTQQRIYGPFLFYFIYLFFAEVTITSTSYLDMLEQFLQPQLFADNNLDLVVFQQDGALPHFAHIVRNYLNETFPGRWIGQGSPRFWAARSRDLTPLGSDQHSGEQGED